MAFQYQAANTACFVTPVAAGTEVISVSVFNSTPAVSRLPDMLPTNAP